MLRSTLAGLRGHLGRLVATTLAVVFGVGFVAGTLIFADTTRAAYTDAFARSAAEVDVAVESRGDRPLTAAQLAAVRALPDVDAAEGRMVASLALLDPRGRPVTNFGSVGVALSAGGDVRLGAYDVAGRAPGAGEALLDTVTAERFGYRVGDTVTVVDTGGVRHAYPLVGLIDLGSSPSHAGDSVLGLAPADITRLTGVDGFEEIVISGREGVSADALAATVAQKVGRGPTVLTGDERRQDLVEAAASWIDSFQLFLLLFGLVSLVVAAFVIYNTFGVLAALRIRQTALLRCVGATRRQVFGATVVESSVIGLVGGVLGILLGVGVAYGLVALLSSTLDSSIPVGTAVVTPVSIAAGLAIGVAVTVVAALVPALRATRTSPLAALRDQPTAAAAPGRRVGRSAVAALVTAAGVGLTVVGVRQPGQETGTVVIVGAGVVTFLGVLIAAPALIGPLSAALGAVPARLFGTPGRLATANARRNPGRTAVTAATLMIGIGLMTVFSVVMTSVDATATRQLTQQYPVDFVATGVRTGDGEATIPPAYATALRARPEFDAVAQVRTAEATIDGEDVRIGAIDPASLGTLVSPPITAGRLADLRPGTAIVSSARSRFGGTPVGATLTVTGGRSSAPLRVVAVAPALAPGTGDLDLLVAWDDLAALSGGTGDAAVLARIAAGVPDIDAQRALDALAGPYPLVSVGSVAELSSDLESQVDSLLLLVAGLLAITVAISVFGIANTLALSVVERTRESATVRALGLTRGQLRGTHLLEALLMAAAGTLVGLGFGLAYGALLANKVLSALQPVVVVPWGWFAGIVLLATVTALLAAVLPARRAARASVVAAMADT